MKILKSPQVSNNIVEYAFNGDVITATLNGEVVITNTGALKVPVSGIIAGTSNIKNNVNFEESGTMGMASSASSDNSFLWNDVVEDEDTLWTKISDPDN